MSTALTQQRAVEIAREHGADLGCNEDAAVIMWPTELHFAMEQYHREAREAELKAWKQWWGGEASQQASVEPVAWIMQHKDGGFICARPNQKALSDFWSDAFPIFTAPPDAEALRKRVSELDEYVKKWQSLHEGAMLCATSSQGRADRLERERDEALAEVERLRNADAEFLKNVIALCTHRGSSPSRIEGFDPEDKWIADLWRTADARLSALAARNEG